MDDTRRPAGPVVESAPGRPDGIATPPAWRLAAATVLAAGWLAGRRLSRWPVRRVAAAGTVAGAAIVAVAARAQRGGGLQSSFQAPPAADLPWVTVLVPARDEATSIAPLVRCIAAQDHRDAAGLARFDLVVIDDGSRDGTGAVASAAADAAGLGAGTRIVRRPQTTRPGGKGAALASVALDDLRGSVVLVLDADARIGTDVVRRVAANVAAGSPAFTARRRVRRAGSGWMARAQADEQALDGFVLRARWRLGGCSELRGNGMAVAVDHLKAVGGWPTASLTEDLDLSTMLAGRLGVRPAWSADVVVWESPTATASALARQRLRWAEGSARRFMAHLPETLRGPALGYRARLDLAAYAGQLALPTVVLGALVADGRRRRIGTGVVILVGYATTAGALTWCALEPGAARGRDAGHPGATLGDETFRPHPAKPGRRRPDRGAGARPRLVRSGVAGLFATTWLIAVPIALGRLALRMGPARFDPTRARLA